MKHWWKEAKESPLTSLASLGSLIALVIGFVGWLTTRSWKSFLSGINFWLLLMLVSSLALLVLSSFRHIKLRRRWDIKLAQIGDVAADDRDFRELAGTLKGSMLDYSTLAKDGLQIFRDLLKLDPELSSMWENYIENWQGLELHEEFMQHTTPLSKGVSHEKFHLIMAFDGYAGKCLFDLQENLEAVVASKYCATKAFQAISLRYETWDSRFSAWSESYFSAIKKLGVQMESHGLIEDAHIEPELEGA